MKYSILIVDDEVEMCKSLSEILQTHGYTVTYTTNPLKVKSILQRDIIDLVIMDIKMPQLSGIDTLKAIKKDKKNTDIIMITGYPSVDSAVRAMKYGALNFYTKPIKIPELLNEINQLAKSRTKRDIYPESKFKYKLVTINNEMLKIIETIEKVAPTDAPVIIQGESGTGKELVANSLHYKSRRANEPFIKVNCAALPDTILESELFGHEKGAFTDAIKTHKGKFELANGGTIFLDEIGDMSLNTQAKILRVLQEKEFERVGGSDILQTDIRVIAATNKDINKLIKEGKFREDLYYRLSVITIDLPPLRKRKDDILPLAKHFLRIFNKQYSKEIKDFTERVENIFLNHNWPGNVRELKNCIERAVIFCESNYITEKELPTQYQQIIEKNESFTLDKAYDNISRDMILKALAKSNGVKQKAAEILNIHRKTLYNKMKKLGIE